MTKRPPKRISKKRVTKTATRGKFTLNKSKRITKKARASHTLKQRIKKKRSSSPNAMDVVVENQSSDSNMQVSSRNSSLFSEENKYTAYLPETNDAVNILTIPLPRNANLTFLSDETKEIAKVMNDLPTNNIDCVARSMILNAQYMLDPVVRNTFIQGAKMYVGVINIEKEYINDFREMIAPGDYYRKRLFDTMDSDNIYGFVGYRNINNMSSLVTAFKKLDRKIPDDIPEYITSLGYIIDSDKPTAYGHAVNFAVTKDNSNTYYYHLLDLQLYQEQFKDNQNHILRASSIEELLELAKERWWNGKIPDSVEVIAYTPWL